MVLRGVDISHHQNDAGLNLGVLLGAVDFVIVKATQGTGYTDARYAANIAAARAAGELCGSYHYAGATGVVPGDPVAEADYYLSVANHQPGEILVLDYEPGKPPADPDGWCAAFCARVRDRTGVLPLVYMSGSVARSGTWAKTRALGVGLWIAQYGTNTGTKPSTAPSVGAWGGYVMWQFTSNGRLPGASGVLDINEFYGDAAAWRALGSPTQGDDMPLTDDDLRKLHDAVWFGASGATLIPNELTGGGEWAKTALGSMTARIGRDILAPQVTALRAEVAALRAGESIDADEVTTRISEAVSAKLMGSIGAVVREVLGEDNAEQADAIVDKLAARLAARATSPNT